MLKFAVKITEDEPLFTLPWTIHFGSTTIAHCDNLTRALMVERALKAWENTPDYEAWYKEAIEPIAKKEIEITKVEIE